MPDEPDDAPAESGDLTARLKQLEDRIATEPPARPRRRTPPKPSAPLVLPEVDDERLGGAPAATDEPEAEAPLVETLEEPVVAPLPEPAADPAAEEAPVAPVKKAPVKRAAAKKVAPAKTPAAARPVKKAPAKRPSLAAATPAATPWPVRETLTPPAAPTRPAAVPAPSVPAPAPATPLAAPPRERDGLVRALVVLAVLLLAVAAGLGAAALVEHRDSSYRAGVVVKLSPGPDPQAPIEDSLSAGVTKYAGLAASHAFTVNAAQRAGVASSDVQGDVQAAPSGSDAVSLTVKASSAAATRKLAQGAGDALVEAVNLQEAADQTSAGDRLSAAVDATPPSATKTAPKARDAWVAGLLGAGAVLVLAGVGAVVRSGRRD